MFGLVAGLTFGGFFGVFLGALLEDALDWLKIWDRRRKDHDDE